jgi:transcriptional regulator with XRE-family HTH domain
LPKKIGVRSNYLSDIETGQRAISRLIAKKLAGIFNVNPGVFLSEDMHVFTKITNAP